MGLFDEGAPVWNGNGWVGSTVFAATERMRAVGCPEPYRVAALPKDDPERERWEALAALAKEPEHRVLPPGGHPGQTLAWDGSRWRIGP